MRCSMIYCYIFCDLICGTICYIFSNIMCYIYLMKCSLIYSLKQFVIHLLIYWPERAAFQLVGRLTTTLVATKNDTIFSFSFPGIYFSHRRSTRIKNLFRESWRKRPKTWGKTPFQTPSAILGPPGGHFGFLRFS